MGQWYRGADAADTELPKAPTAWALGLSHRTSAGRGLEVTRCAIECGQSLWSSMSALVLYLSLPVACALKGCCVCEGGGGGWHKALVAGSCWPVAAPIGLSPLNLLL